MLEFFFTFNIKENDETNFVQDLTGAIESHTKTVKMFQRLFHKKCEKYIALYMA
jgi:hypothetical protein